MFALTSTFYLSYRWVATHKARLMAYGHAALSYPPVVRLWERYDRQLHWLLRRLTPGEYLGLHLTLGFVAATGCLWLFALLVENVFTNDPLVRFDQAVATILHDSATPALTWFFLVVTALGSLETMALLALLVATFFVWRQRWVDLRWWLAASAGAAVLNQLLKEFFARPRPYFEHPLILEISYSFPSGHSMESLVVYGMLAYVLVLTVQPWRSKTAVVFGAALLVLLIGLSRMYLGAHYFSDVAAGFAAGGLWLSACITAAEVVRRSKPLSQLS